MVVGYEIAVWLLLIIASITDLLWGKIFNALTFPALAIGLIVHFWVGGFPAEKQAWLGIGVALLLFFPLYLMKALAAADVKLLMAVGAWSDAGVVARLALLSILVGAVVGATVLFRKLGVSGGLQSTADHAKLKSGVKSHRMPFAPAFLCAFLVLKVTEMYGWNLF